MKCNRFRVEALRNEEWFQFYTEFKALVEQYGASSLNIDALFAVFVSLYADADTALEIIRKSATTQQLQEADTVRDSTFRGLVDAVKSARNHFDTVKRDAARRIQIVIEQYGNIARKAYDDETASIYNFVQEMRGQYHMDIMILGLLEWIDQLDASNQTFSTLMESRYAEEAGKTDLRMAEVREKTDRCYRDMIDRFDALMLVNGTEAYAPFVTELNIRVSRFENMLSQRKGRSEAKKKREEEAKQQAEDSTE